MNNINGEVPHDYVKYRQGPRTYALWQVNGEWITSTKTNYEVYKIAKKRTHDEEVRKARANGTIKPKSLFNKTNRITYMQALKAKKLIESGASTYKISKDYDVDYRVITRAVKLADEFGPKGFYRYG